nr:unnamed protein product [Digitaria exilis]
MAPAAPVGLAAMAVAVVVLAAAASAAVTYDRKAVVVNGQRRILLSGSIHYPRSVPEMWPDLIQKAKDGGLDVVQTYVFWNGHEPCPGQYYFEGRYDLVHFIKLVKQAGLYVHLRIGPYVCAEWNFGVHESRVKNTASGNLAIDLVIETEMQKFTTKIVDMMKSEGLFEWQGGPIILSQIENELGPLEWDQGEPTKAYASWAANMAVALNTGVPWIMCKEDDAPDPIINTCNGFYCDWFSPNKPHKPTMWTEAWTAWYTGFGIPVPHRPVEDLAYGVAKFIQKGGSFVNYYMYHGGTNFGRTAGGPFIATSYDYDAPIDEYGDPIVTSLGNAQQASVFRSTGACVAFLENKDKASYARVAFNGMHYDLPPWSISILPDCKTTVYNTAKNVGEHFETWNAGILGPVTLDGLNEGRRYLTWQKWTYQVGLRGETLSLHSLSGSSSVEWGEPMQKQPLTWYKAFFNAPDGDEPLALDMSSMGKGQIWINGQGIGRYHVPRPWLNPTGNLLVVFEEWGGDPTGISMVKRTTGSICADVSEWQPSMKNWHTKDYEKAKIHLQCDHGRKITEIKFASFGTPQGSCGGYSEGACHAHKSYDIFWKNCIGQERCGVSVVPNVFGGDPCPGTMKRAVVEAICG